MTDINTISDILLKYMHSPLNPEEQHILDTWLTSSIHNQCFFEDINKEEKLRTQVLLFNSDRDGKMEDRIFNRVKRELFNGSRVAHRVHFLPTAWFRYAAVVLILLGIGSYLWFTNRNQSALITANDTKNKSTNAEIIPGSNRAILKLADGSQIILDNSVNGKLAEQGNAQVIKLMNGQLAYQIKGNASSKVMMNTMTTPKGGQYRIQLPDGTNVWLNAASSITYPTSFIGKTREVIVNGEAYFEVKSNKGQPFFVKTNSTNVQVLGTSFNVHEYENESSKISLLKGSVKVNNGLLVPGQAYENGKIISTNTDQDIAWMNGFFNFEGIGIQEAMRQIQRWYDIEVIYEKGISDIEFVGKISRNLKLSELLNALEQIGVHFKMEGRRLTVMP